MSESQAEIVQQPSKRPKCKFSRRDFEPRLRALVWHYVLDYVTYEFLTARTSGILGDSFSSMACIFSSIGDSGLPTSFKGITLVLSKALERVWISDSGKNDKLTSRAIKYLEDAYGGPFHGSRKATLAVLG